MEAIAEHCQDLHTLKISGCTKGERECASPSACHGPPWSATVRHAPRTAHRPPRSPHPPPLKTVTDKGLLYLADRGKCQDLATLNIMDCSGITDVSVVPLAETSPDLKRVDLKGTSCTDAR